MKDFAGNELRVGDHVIHRTSGRYSRLRKAVIVGFTPSMVKIETKTRFSDQVEVTNVNADQLVIPYGAIRGEDQ